jgi:type III secretion system YscQ/HrcQ family protein
MARKKLRKFRWSDLRRLSRVQARVVNMLLAHFPQTPFERGFKERLRDALEPILHADLDFWLDDVSVVERGELGRIVAEPACLAIVGLVPRSEKILLEVDLPSAQHAIDKLLGGDAGDVDAQRALSEIEDGVFSFVLLKALSVVHETFGGERQIAMKLEALYGSLDAVSGHIAADERFVALSFKVFIDQRVGVARLFLPATLVESDFAPGWPDEGPARDRLLASYAARKGMVRLLRAPLVIEVGRLSLPMADIDNLEADDIVLVEQTDARLVRTGDEDDDAAPVLTGQVMARVGAGAHGTLLGPIGVGANGCYEVTIDTIVPSGEPRAMGVLFPPDSDGYVDEENAMEESRRLPSRAPIADEPAHAARLRAAAARAAVAGAAPAAPLARAPADEERDAAVERSDGYGDDDDGGGGEPPPSAEAAALLDDVTVAMVVELGRVMVSAADVMGLRPGQVIELSRQPGEAVDLVVDGKRIGKGELVEIDGELGVRILSLSR